MAQLTERTPVEIEGQDGPEILAQTTAQGRDDDAFARFMNETGAAAPTSSPPENRRPNLDDVAAFDAFGRPVFERSAPEGGGDAPDTERTFFDTLGAVAADAGRGAVEAPRQMVGGLRDAAQAALDLVGEIDSPLFVQITDPNTGRFAPDVLTAETAAARGLQPAELPDIRDAESTTGGVVRVATQFLAPFSIARKALVARNVGQVGSAFVAGAFADGVAFDGHVARLADLWQEADLPGNVLTDYLASDPEDSEIEGRFKNVIEGAGLGVLAEGVFGAARMIRSVVRARQVDGAAVVSEATARQEARYGRVSREDLRVLGDLDAPALVTGRGRTAAEADRVLLEGREQAAALRQQAEEAVKVRGFFTTGRSRSDSLLQQAADVEAAATRRANQLRAGPGSAANFDTATAEAATGVPDDVAARGLVLAGGEGGEEVFINFARIETSDDIRRVMGQMADAFSGSIDDARRGVQTNDATKQLADDLGMTVDDLLARRRGQPFNAEEAVAARRLWAASGEKLVEVARRAAAPTASSVDQFAFRRMMATHHAIQKEVIAARTEAARALQAWSIPVGGNVETARNIQLMLEASGGVDLSTEMARRLVFMAEEGAPSQAIGEFAQRGFGATTLDGIREVWINGLLSSPKTHMVNIMSNTSVAVQQVIERRAAAAVSRLTGSNAVSPMESAAMMHGLIEGTKDGFRLAWKALRTGQTGHTLGKLDLPRASVFSDSNFRNPETALARGVDAIGKIVNVPGRLLGAEDEFFKSIGYRMEIHAQAVRQAAGEGLQGRALKARVADIVANPPESVRVEAADAALYNTFTNVTGEWAGAILKMREAGPMGKATSFILPFVRTPANIAKYAFERTPLAPLVGQWRADIAAGGVRRDIALARMSTGTLAMLAAADFATSGNITGSGPTDSNERAAWMRQGNMAYSVRVGDKWFSYNRLDPFGMTLGFAADIAQAMERSETHPDDMDEWQEATAMALATVANVAISKQYLSGMAEFMEMMGDPTRYSESYINNFLGSFTPFASLNLAVTRANDPTLRDVNSPVDAVYARIAGLAETLPAKRDLWGEVIRIESGLGTAFDFAAPIAVRNIKDSPIDAEMTRLGAFVSKIDKRTSFRGVPVNFKNRPEIYERYVELAGNGVKHPAWGLGAKDFLNAVVSGNHPLSQVYDIRSDGPDGQKIAFIRSTIADYRQLAQDVIMNDPEFEDFAEEIRAKQADARTRRMPTIGGQ